MKRLHNFIIADRDNEPAWRSAAVHGCEFGRRLAAWIFVERDARQTRRRDACATFRFMESLNLQEWTRIGAVNRLDEVGRVTPCAPSLALQEIVVAAVGAQGTARPTFRFMESFNLQDRTRMGAMNRAKRDVRASNVLPTSRRQTEAPSAGKMPAAR